MTSTKSSAGRRAWGERDARKPLLLTARDGDVLQSLATYRFLTTGQIAALHFPTKSKAIRRLRLLYDHGYVDRLERPVTSGKAELVYALWTKGAKVVASSTRGVDASCNWKPSRNRVKPDHLDHELALVHFHLAMGKAVSDVPGVEWLFWKSREELAVGKGLELLSAGTHRGGKLTLIPDAFFVLRTPRGRTACFAEIDRGTEAGRSVFRKKLLAYELAYTRGVVERAYGFRAFRVLTVTASEARARQFLVLASRLQHPLLYWFSTTERLERTSALTGPAWQHGAQPSALMPLYAAKA